MAVKSPASVNRFKVDEDFRLSRRHVESTPLSRLATAVLERAVIDVSHVCGCSLPCECEEHRVDALQFLTGADEDLDFWCEHAGLNPQAVRERYAHRL